MTAEHPECNYTQVCAKKDGHLIAVAYSDTPISLESDLNRVTIVNGSGNDGTLLRVKTAQNNFVCRIYDCLGNCIAQRPTLLSVGVHSFEVPDSGRLELTRSLS